MTPEERLGSSYLLGEHIGSGTFGEVRRAVDRDGHPWAVKILRHEYAQDPDVVRRFVQERQVLSGIRHPNIVEVHDLVIEGDTLAIVMDHVEGSTLRALLDAEGTLPPAQVAEIGRQLASALVAVHARDVIHRDLKPDNVLLDAGTDPATPRLSDFGIAEIVSERVADATFVGTPAYLAPEVAEGHAPTAAADLYSLGIVLYELSCGRTPFADRDNVIATLTAQVAAPPPRPPGLPDDLWDVISALLSKSPARRPASASVTEMWLDGLTESLAGLPAAAPFAVAATAAGAAAAAAAAAEPAEDEEATQAMPVAAAPGTAAAAAPSDEARPTESAEASGPPLTALPPPSTPPVRFPVAPTGEVPSTGRPAHPPAAGSTGRRGTTDQGGGAVAAAAPADPEPKRRVAPILIVAASVLFIGGGILVATQPKDQPLISRGPLGAVGMPTLSAAPPASPSTSAPSSAVPAGPGQAGWAGADQLTRQIPRIQERGQATPNDANRADPGARDNRTDPNSPTRPPRPGDSATTPGPGGSPTGSGPGSSTTPGPTSTPTARPSSSTVTPTANPSTTRPRPTRTRPTPTTTSTGPTSTTTPPPGTTTTEPPASTPPPETTSERQRTTRDDDPEPPTASAFRTTDGTGPGTTP